LKFLKDKTVLQKISILTTFSFLCIAVVSTVMFRLMMNSISQQVTASHQKALNLQATMVEKETQKTELQSMNLIMNSTVQDILASFSKTSQNDEYTRLINTNNLSQLLFQTIGLSQSIQHIEIIADDGTCISSSDTVVSSGELGLNGILAAARGGKGSPLWYKSSVQPNQILEVRAIRSIRSSNIDEQIGTMLIWVNMDKLIRNIDENHSFGNNQILIKDGDSIFYFSSKDLEKFTSGKYENGSSVKIDGTAYLVSHITSQRNRWDYYILSRKDEIFGPINSIAAGAAGVTLVVFALVICGCYIVSRQIINPLSVLAKQMKMVETGNFDINEKQLLANTGDDEIGSLCRDFVFMSRKIGDLINVDYKNRIVIQETKLKALQSQMNPHFLYNVLDSVNWLSKIGKNEEIGILVKNLSKLLRAIMSNKCIYHTIGDEIALVNSYIAIQTVRYGEKLQFYSDVEPELLHCKIPKLLLQPIIENSITYGLEATGKVCAVSLSIQPEGSDNIEILVCDNGPGIPEDQIRKILSGEFVPRGNGIGLNNINQRIHIAFGDRYGLRIKSSADEGTSVTIRIPKTETVREGE
jgi:two-component system sensor histidine kinase YesM